MIVIRPATPADAPLILTLIRELAEYEKMLDEVETTLADVELLLFSGHPKAFCDIAELDGEPVGQALWFYNLSTFTGRHGLYLEDLYVRPRARGKGAGLALLKALAQRCRDEGLARLEWMVLDWNAPAIGFYDRIGAQSLDDWRLRRLSGDALAELAR